MIVRVFRHDWSRRVRRAPLCRRPEPGYCECGEALVFVRGPAVGGNVCPQCDAFVFDLNDQAAS